VQFGLTHTRNATDQAGGGTAADVVRDQESTSVFASITHRVTARITGNAIATYQRSTANGGTIDGSVDSFFLLGLNLQYRINNNWLTEIGYNLDNLDSDQPDRGFTRNRIYAGVTANF
jgi:uncharacterized protein (PEP-CTERM system associated)